MAAQAYQAVGAAVVACQLLEVAFVICVKLVFAQKDARAIADIRPLDRSAFRPPTMGLLKELGNHIRVDPRFADRLANVVDRRHHLVHRWAFKEKWPADADIEGNRKVIEFGNALARDASALTRLLVHHIHLWIDKFPQIRAQLEPLDAGWLSALPAEYRGLRIEGE